MKRLIFCLLIICTFFIKLDAQNNYFKKNIKELTSKKYNGRGYTYNGMEKASIYLSKEFKKIGLKSDSDNFLQQESFPINIIHKAELTIDNKLLQYGEDFIVKPSSKSNRFITKKDNYYFNVEDYISSFQSKQKTIDFIKNDEVLQNGKNIILPPLVTKVDSIKNYYKQWANTYQNHLNEERAVFRFISDSLTASLSQKQVNVTEFIIKEKYFSDTLSNPLLFKYTIIKKIVFA